jgi:ATP-dependent DNA helicase RecQ
MKDEDWRNVFRQLVALGLAAVDHAAYGALKLTAASRPVLRGEQEVEMRSAPEKRPSKRGRAPIGPASASSADVQLLDKLKTWRRDEAQRQAVPAYVILNDATVTEIARRRPGDLAALEEVPGIGQKRLERYGAALIALIAAER